MHEEAGGYCTECGAELVETKTKIHRYFDPKTGKRADYAYHYWRCPRKRWFFDHHTTRSDDPGKYEKLGGI